MLIILLSISLVCPVTAQTKGKISGLIVDADNGEPLIGVNVSITDQAIGTATDIDGRYTITGLNPGTYSVTISYVSYSTKTITNVVVNAGEVTTINIDLAPETLDLDEVVISAESVVNTEAALLAIQRKSVPVQDGLSVDMISKNSDGDVGSAMKRVTGVTVMNGKDIFVRGLGARYSNVQLNGAQMPSTDPNKAEAPVDVISSDLIDNIIVQKTYTVDQEAEFSGGAVKIQTKQFPDDRRINVSYGTKYNSLTTFNSLYGYKGSSTDFLGFDSGKRKMPSIIKNERLTIETEKQVIKQLHNTWMPTNDYKAIPSQSLDISYTNQFNQDKLPLGLVTSFGYAFDNISRPNEIYRYINNYNEATNKSTYGADYVRNAGTRNTQLTGMVNVFVKPTKNIKLGLKNLYTNSSEDNAAILEGNYWNYDRPNRQTIINFQRISLYNSALIYDHYLPFLFNTTLKSEFSYIQAVKDVPDRRNTQYFREDDGRYQILFSDKGNFHYFSNQNDINYSGKIDFTTPITNKIKISYGGMVFYKDRTFNAKRLEYQDLSNRLPAADRYQSPDYILSDRFVDADIIDLVETTTSRDSYVGTQLTTAGYLSVSQNLFNKITYDIGLRFESTDQKINGDSKIKSIEPIPALNVTYSINDKSNFRIAASRTLERPEFRELSNYNFQDFIGGRAIYGNPNLKQTVIYNYDTRFEIYPGLGDMIAVSAFYKHFSNPIEVWNRLTDNYEVFFANVETAHLYGIEFEMRKSLTDNLKLSGNVSYMQSEVAYGSNSDAKNRNANEKRPMFGQSPYTINLNLYYTISKTRTDFTFGYNTFGKRISTIGSNTMPDDEYEMPFNKVDLTVVQPIGSVKYKVAISNLLNESVEFRQGREVTNSYLVGVTYSFGVSYTF